MDRHRGEGDRAEVLRPRCWWSLTAGQQDAPRGCPLRRPGQWGPASERVLVGPPPGLPAARVWGTAGQRLQAKQCRLRPGAGALRAPDAPEGPRQVRRALCRPLAPRGEAFSGAARHPDAASPRFPSEACRASCSGPGAAGAVQAVCGSAGQPCRRRRCLTPGLGSDTEPWPVPPLSAGARPRAVLAEGPSSRVHRPMMPWTWAILRASWNS